MMDQLEMELWDRSRSVREGGNIGADRVGAGPVTVDMLFFLRSSLLSLGRCVSGARSESDAKSFDSKIRAVMVCERTREDSRVRTPKWFLDNVRDSSFGNKENKSTACFHVKRFS